MLCGMIPFYNMLKQQIFNYMGIKPSNTYEASYLSVCRGTTLGDKANYHRLLAPGHKAKSQCWTPVENNFAWFGRRYIIAIPLWTLVCCCFI